MDQKWEISSVRRIITTISFRKCMEFSIIRFYSKAITIQETHKEDRIRFYFNGSQLTN